MVEVYLFRGLPDGRLAYRCAAGQLREAESPDQAALRIGGRAAGEGDLSLAVHSTSWRHRPDGAIILAYAVLPDPCPHLPAAPLADTEIARGPRADRPSPDHVRRDQVAAHAARHMALITRTDTAVRLVLSAHPELGRALAELAPALAGELTV